MQQDKRCSVAPAPKLSRTEKLLPCRRLTPRRSFFSYGKELLLLLLLLFFVVFYYHVLFDISVCLVFEQLLFTAER